MNAQEAAASLLRHSDGSYSFPVDPVHLAKQLGISVITMELPSNVSGALIKEQDKDPVIVLSKNDNLNRWRFSCAHELGHYAYRMINDGDNYEYIDFRDSQSSLGTDTEEIYANQFAASLLMPEEDLRQAYKTMPIFMLPQYFGVSNDAMNFRLKSLSLKK